VWSESPWTQDASHNGASLYERSKSRWRSLWRVGLRPRSAGALGFALVCVAIATGVRIGLGLISPDSAIFASYYSATLVASLVGGAAAGTLAAVSGGIVAYSLFVPPDWASSPFMMAQVVSLVLYGASSVVIIWAAESYRGLLARLREQENVRELLNRELAHRIKNTLASVQAVVAQSLRDHPDLMGKIRGRIAALAATHDLLTRSEWQEASLREILAGELAPYGPARFALDGKDVACPSAVATVLTLIFHELTTNATKYGALSTADGRVRVAWTLIAGRLELEWRESGGPPVSHPTRQGFGTKLVRTSVTPFGGSVDLRFEPAGLRCKLALMLPQASGAQVVAPGARLAKFSAVIPDGEPREPIRDPVTPVSR
jgi:two-component sensor histidine kinase